MISARGPDSTSADEPGIDVRAPLLRVARQSPRPLHRVSASLGRVEQPRCSPASNPFPSGLLPSGLAMAKPTILQARRAGAYRGLGPDAVGQRRRLLPPGAVDD